MLVLDPSVAAKWFIESESDRSAQRILQRIRAGEVAYAPSLFRWEIENLLLSAQRAGRIDASDAEAALDALRDLPIVFEPPGERFFRGSEFGLAFAYELSAYDAAYLATAISFDAELVTADSEMAAAARDLGIVTTFVHASSV